MTRGELVVVIFFVLATAFVSGFLAVALKYPELLPWYSKSVAPILPACFHLLGRVAGLKREPPLTPSALPARPIPAPSPSAGSHARPCKGIRGGMSVTPPGWKSKDHDAINRYDDIAPGGVSFHHSFQSDLGEHRAFPILQCEVGSFHEIEAVGIIFIPAAWSVTKRRMMIRTGLIGSRLGHLRAPERS